MLFLQYNKDLTRQSTAMQENIEVERVSKATEIRIYRTMYDFEGWVLTKKNQKKVEILEQIYSPR